MNSPTHDHPQIIRTERGLTIAGTRITLYDVMDYLLAHYPPHFIQGLFDLTEPQIKAALVYIDAYRPAVEAEYAQVVKDAEELRQYYEAQNRERVTQIATLPPPPGMEAAWAKLQHSRSQHQPEP